MNKIKMSGIAKYLPVTLVTILWGMSFVATKFVVSVFAPFPAALYRFTIALIVLLPFTKKRKIWDINAFWAGFWGITMYFVFENTALIYTAPTNASVIVSSAPIIYTIFTHVFHKTSTTKNHYIGSVIAFLGVALVVFNGRLAKMNPIGDILAFGSALSWVLYTYYIMKIEENDGVDSIFSITFWGVVTLLPFSLFQDMSITIEPKSLISLIYLGILCSAVGYLIWNKSIALIGDRSTTNFVYFIPVITMLSESIFIKSQLTLYNILGTLMLIIGLYIFERGESHGKK
ncbi:MAG TPA: DMT family transporter [Fervidobacterium sp.]|nr:DMT family transporter [Fervidobacterium sp.]HPP17934.1 DMT family transporter [Fervidobacterium sp.]